MKCGGSPARNVDSRQYSETQALINSRAHNRELTAGKLLLATVNNQLKKVVSQLEQDKRQLETDKRQLIMQLKDAFLMISNSTMQHTASTAETDSITASLHACSEIMQPPPSNMQRSNSNVSVSMASTSSGPVSMASVKMASISRADNIAHVAPCAAMQHQQEPSNSSNNSMQHSTNTSYIRGGSNTHARVGSASEPWGEQEPTSSAAPPWRQPPQHQQYQQQYQQQQQQCRQQQYQQQYQQQQQYQHQQQYHHQHQQQQYRHQYRQTAHGSGPSTSASQPSWRSDQQQRRQHYQRDSVELHMHKQSFILQAPAGAITGQGCDLWQSASNRLFQLLPSDHGYIAFSDCVHLGPRKQPSGNIVDRFLLIVLTRWMADNLVRFRHHLKGSGYTLLDALTVDEQAAHDNLWPVYLDAKARGVSAQFNRARLFINGREELPFTKPYT